MHFRAAPLDKTRGSGYNLFGFRSLIAQLAERSAVNRNVVGSSPTQGAISPSFLGCALHSATSIVTQEFQFVSFPFASFPGFICRSEKTSRDSRPLISASRVP